MKVGRNIEINLAAKSGSVRMQMPFGASYSVPPLTAAQLGQLASLAAKRSESLQEGAAIDPALTFDQVNPQDGDFIYPKFRALSQTLIPGYFIDFSKDKVVEEAAPLMLGQTIFTNHERWDIEDWVGAVSKSEWDAKGDKTGGVAGINVELKIDWKSNPKIARGLLMTPPAIRAVSASVEFDWDASHPDLLEQGIFWRNLGQDIDNNIVRIIVTKINSFIELSLVGRGANPESNSHLPDDEDEEFSADRGKGSGARGHLKPAPDTRHPTPLTKKEKHTVKLTAEQKTALGITLEGEDVPDADVISKATSFAQRAAAADGIVSAERAEVLRLATLAEGTGEGDERKLPPAIATLIEKADASQLPALKTMYEEKAKKAFPLTCQKCGSQDLKGRSSVEDRETQTSDEAVLPDTDLL